MSRSIGWREWASLPDLGLPFIKAKIDTGAKTSCLHAFALENFQDGEREMVRFRIHPLRKREDIIVVCEAPVLDHRVVKDSGGHAEERIVISSTINLGGKSIETPITLTSRDDMLFRMLIGRRTLVNAGFTVDVSQSYALGRYRTRQVLAHYQEEVS